MNMKLPCAVVRDLLPLYAEKLTEAETRKLVDEHLENCAECRQRLADMDAESPAPVESAKPLIALKKEIRKRRWFSAVAAALVVFVVFFAFFCHETRMEPVPWQSGLIEVEGIEARTYGEVYEGAEASDTSESAVDVLVLRVDGRINGTSESVFIDDDGSRTLILQGWSSNHNVSTLAMDSHEMIFCPVPDRPIYTAGSQQMLLWGKPMNGGVEILPRLALGFYVIIAAGSALVFGIIWFLLRRQHHSWIPRQLFFAPASYATAHLLIMGIRTESFFMERDFLSILLSAAALYALVSLVWQLWLQHREAA